MPFAGHPNVGTAFALATLMAGRGETVPERFLFEEQAGLVPVSLTQQHGVVTGAELLAPEPLAHRGRVARQDAAACLSLTAEEIRTDAHEPQVLSVGLPFLVVELTSHEALHRATPNRAGFSEVLPLDGARSVYAYTRASPEDGAEIYARMFTPRLTEDPAPGAPLRQSLPYLRRPGIPLTVSCASVSGRGSRSDDPACWSLAFSRRAVRRVPSASVEAALALYQATSICRGLREQRISRDVDYWSSLCVTMVRPAEVKTNRS